MMTEHRAAPSKRARRGAPAWIALALALAGCKQAAPPEPPPPTEALVVVKANEAPFLNELEDDEAPAQMGRPGDLLLAGKDLPGLATTWKARFDGQPYERSGPMSELRQAPGDAILYGFKVDLGQQVEAPLTSWICAQIAREANSPGADPACTRLLRRSLLPDGALIAFSPCSSGPCPVALVRSNKVRAIRVEGISSARVVHGEGGVVLLATTRWVRDEGKWTGGALVPIALSGEAPRALAPIALDEIDARDPQRVAARMVQIQLGFPDPEHTTVRVHGDRRENALADGKELSRSPIDETRVIPGR